MLDLYNTKTRTLRLKDVLGDIRVRAGTLLVVMLGPVSYTHLCGGEIPRRARQ